MQKEYVALMDVTENDLELIFKWRNKPSIRRVMFNSNEIVWEEHLRWFHELSKKNTEVLKILYYDNIPLGVANFRIIDDGSNSGEWGFYIGEEKAPKGSGTLLAYSMLDYLFSERKIRKVSAKVLDFNTVSLIFHEKIGFTREGILEEHIFKNNRYCDVYLYSIFGEDWVKRKVLLEREIFNRVMEK